MSTIILGQNRVVEQPRRRVYEPGKGWQTVRSWRGPRTLIDEFVSAYTADLLNMQLNITDKGSHSQLDASFAGNGSPPAGPDLSMETRWELSGDDLERPVATNAHFSALSAATIGRLDDALEKNRATAYGAANEDVECEYLALRLKGVDSYLDVKYTLRKITTVSRRSAVKVEFLGVGQIYTAQDLVDLESMKLPLNASLPNMEWLKRAPSLQESGNSRYAFTHTWLGATQWDRTLYSLLTPEEEEA